MTYSLVGVALAFGVGILVERLLPLALGNVALLGLATGAAILSVVLARLSRGFLVGLLVAVGALGALRAQSGERSFADLYRRVPELREVTGTVVSYPDLRPTTTTFFFAPDSLSARLRVTVFWGEGVREEVYCGDRLRLKGETELAARLPGFDYRRYLAEQGVFALMDVDGEEGLERLGIGGSRFLRLGNVLRERLLDRLDRVISADVAALAHGLLFGERASLSDEVDEAFRRTGLTHLLAISGMNLAIFLAGLWFVLRFLGLRPVLAYPLVGASVLAILWLVGLPVSLVRAAILFGFLALGSVLADLGAILRRSVSVTQGLAAAALVILAIRPTALFDVGFQLSFGATAAIVAVVSLALGESESASPRAERNALLERVARYGAGLVAVSLAAQAGTAPFLAWHFGMVYPLSLFANLLIVPLATVAMWVGAVALFLCATPLFPLAGAAFGGLLGAMIWCVERLAALPLTAVAVSPVVGIWLAGVSLYVFGALLLLRRGAQDPLGGASGVLR